MHRWYQEPMCLPPINSDNSSGKPSDHLTVVMTPLDVINNKPLRKKRIITVRPIMESGINLFTLWVNKHQWTQLEETSSIDTKVEMFNTEVLNKINQCFPQKEIKLTSDDSLWCSEKVKKLKRIKCREYNKHRKSEKWLELKTKYDRVVKEEKTKFYKRVMKDLKESNPSQWYSRLKRFCSYDLEKQEVLHCEEIDSLSDQEQADELADHFSNVRNLFDELRPGDIQMPEFDEITIPQISQI